MSLLNSLDGLEGDGEHENHGFFFFFSGNLLNHIAF